ncbi:c-type cytochrome [Microvirga splendida]|uniref:Cytochrome c4 n=1 Tax=Microvirga splendida TaxID=2795727 RepID=A0ABS0Y3X8_9HYPH|nr:c-type cytochrome [Microvirga splendida]MBJ6127011.1 cytochrome c4 [Microvirga splendida]
MPALRPFPILVALPLFGLALASVQAQDGRATSVMAYDAGTADVERGRAVVVGAFAAQPGQGNNAVTPPAGACFQCHGMDGKGDAAAAFPRLTDQVYKYLYDSLQDYASGARQSPIMTPIAKALSDQQMRDVSAYYAAQKDAPYGPSPQADPSVLQYGAAIAAVGHAPRGVQGCINCHGPDGFGLPPTYPYLAGQNAAYLEAQLRAWKTGERKGDGFGLMENIAKRLTDEEIHAVSQYYAAIRPRSVTPEQVEAAAPIVPLPRISAPPVGR